MQAPHPAEAEGVKRRDQAAALEAAGPDKGQDLLLQPSCPAVRPLELDVVVHLLAKKLKHLFQQGNALAPEGLAVPGTRVQVAQLDQE